MKADFWTNPLVLGAAIIVVAGMIAALLPGVGFWPSTAGAKPAAHRPNQGAKYGTIHFVPSTQRSTQSPATAGASTESTPPSETTQPAETTEPSSGEATTQSSETSQNIPDESAHMTGDFLGWRSALDNHGIDLDFTLLTDFGKNFTGGANTHGAGIGYEFNLSVAIDTNALMNFQGGTFFANFRAQEGLNNSLDGSFGSTSHLYEPQRYELSEIWYQQSILDGKLKAKIGKIDANEDFDNVANGADFLNNFASYSATILAMPSDPDPAFGADLFLYPNDNFYAGIGIWDGSGLDGNPTGSLGPASVFHGSRSAFVIGEVGAKWTLSNARPGRLGVGVWDHTGTIQHLDDDSTEGAASGPYVSFDQTLWKKNPSDDRDEQGIAMFMLAGYANPNLSSVNCQLSGGLTWTGILANRENDVAGLGVGYLGFSQAANAGFDEPSEITVETFYRVQFTQWFYLQPDLQFVHHPGGISSQHDALAGTLQAVIDF